MFIELTHGNGSIFVNINRIAAIIPAKSGFSTVHVSGYLNKEGTSQLLVAGDPEGIAARVHKIIQNARD
jgi:hypothetical protein